MINKITIVLLVIFIWIFATFWTFNHIDPWVSIGMFILGIYIIVKKLEKTTTKKEK